MNQEAYQDFFYWVNERHKIFLKRWRGDPKPWTDDPILRDWKFCNVFRKNDRQSKLLIDNVIKPHWNDDLGLMLFNIYAFRAFNWWPTYQGICSNYGPDWLTEWKPESVKDVLCTMLTEPNSKLTSGAYMIRGREGMPKYESIVQTLTDVWEQAPDIGKYLTKWPKGLQYTQEILMGQRFWGWGPFTTYQVVLDLTYTKWLENAVDINTWCEFGPGAIRGIREIYPNLPKNMMLEAARGLLLDSPKFLEPHVPALNLSDVEFVCCELFKYRRIKAGGKSKQKYDGR